MLGLKWVTVLVCSALIACGGDSGNDTADTTDATDAADATDGVDGTDGTHGTDGADGTDGTDGTDGVDGTNSADGTDATDAADAADGTDAVDAADDGPVKDPATYTFKDAEGASTVAYSGQTLRHVLIADLTSYMGGLTDQIDGGKFTPTDEGDVVGTLNFYFRFDSESDGAEALLLSPMPASKQTDYDSISTGKDLVGKLAGNDVVTDHRDWSKEFSGWFDTGIAAHGGSLSSPEGLVTAFFETLEALAIARADGTVAKGTDGKDLPVYVTETGLDIRQLTQKFLLGAIAFSQAADDYMDSDVDGKGLKSSNTTIKKGQNYTDLAHAWDEAFGYFGAARNYADFTDEEIAGKGGRVDWQGYHDTNSDGAIDLKSEYNFGISVNCAKRDMASKEAVKTNFTDEAFKAFVKGRAIIAAAGSGKLTDAQMTALKAERDKAIGAWEKALAATVVHYITDTLEDISRFGGQDYSFVSHAKHWSELKGFALAFQFNPTSPLADDQFKLLHSLIGDAPILATATEDAIAGYQLALLDARAVLKDAFGFAEANVAGW